MATDYAKAVARLQTLALSMAGIREAPAVPNETQVQYPFSISFARTGKFTINSAGWGTDLGVLRTELHFNRANLSAAVVQAMPYRKMFLLLLVGDPKLNNTVDAINGVSWEFGVMRYGDVETIGWQFNIEVKEHIQ